MSLQYNYHCTQKTHNLILFADHTPPPRLAITTHRTDMNNLFVTFFCLVNSLL